MTPEAACRGCAWIGPAPWDGLCPECRSRYLSDIQSAEYRILLAKPTGKTSSVSTDEPR